MNKNRLFVMAMTTLLLSTQAYCQSVKKIKITEFRQTIAESKKPLVINFWATYCQPCIAEIPYFEKIVASHKKDSVQLLLVSLDLQEAYPAKIKAFLAQRKYKSPVQWLDESNADYFCPKIDSAWSGAIPASLFINNKRDYHKFFETPLSKEKLEKEISAMLVGKH